MAKTLATKTTGPRRIFMVEDHPTFREGLAQILNGEPDLKVCGSAGTAAQALEGIARLKPDLALVDITLPGKSGLELIKELRAANRTVKVLVLSMHDEALYANRVLRAGGDGYIMKQEDPEEIIHAIRDVLSGHIYVSEQVMADAASGSLKRSARAKGRPFDRLTDSELEILALIGRGKSNREIARELRLTAKTVLARCASIKTKLKLKSANALIRYAVCWVETGAT
jgi:DNA-binding NarL/FixJ family response regulator